MPKRIGLIAALKEECRDVLALKGWLSSGRKSGMPLYERSDKDVEIRLVVSGVGAARAERALNRLLEGFAPERIVSFGFAGGIDPDLEPGDVVWSVRSFQWDNRIGTLRDERPLYPPPDAVSKTISKGAQYFDGAVISVDSLTPKERIRENTDTYLFPAVVDMETHALAEVLDGSSIPLISLRSVSDELGLEVGQLVGKWMDDDLNVKPSRALWDILTHPSRIGVLSKLARRSRLASRSLAEALRSIVEGGF